MKPSEQSTLFPVVVLVLIVAIAWGIHSVASPPITGDSVAANTTNASVASNTDDSKYSQHSSDYIYSFLVALSELYGKTKTYSEAQATFGESQSDVVILTALNESATHLQNASSSLQPYLNDSDKAISATATLLWADITKELQDVNQMRSSYSSAIQNQDVQAVRVFQTQMASFAADDKTLQDDLSKILQIIKYIIEHPTNDPNPSGSIDYAISAENRTGLVQQIHTLFPTPLDHNAALSNIYLLWARSIELILTAETYEVQDSMQI